MRIRNFQVILIFLISLGCTKPKPGESLSGSPAVATGDIEEGKKLYSSCLVCHGTSGQGNLSLKSPSLVNLDRWYLYRQLMNFKLGIRGNSPGDSSGFQMATVSNILKDSVDVQNVAAYISTLPKFNPSPLINGDTKKGQRTYENLCGSCHGQGARGNEKMNAPKLNGLDDWYMKRQIYSFKNGIRGSHPKDVLGAQMVPMMALLTSDQAVDDVIAYIRSTTQANTE